MSRAQILRFLGPGLLAASLTPAAFAAGQATGSMNVTLTVPTSCTLGVITNVSFGSQNPTASTVINAGSTAGSSKGQIDLTCRKKTTATITLASTVNNFNMKNSAGTSQPYTLRLPSSTTVDTAGLSQCTYPGTLWPSAGQAFGPWNSTGTQSIAVCATTTVDGTTEAGDYTDTVSVTVDY